MSDKQADSKNKNSIIGVFYGAIGFTAWGFLPIYWKLLDEIPADEILAHRIFWSFLFVGGILLFKNGIGTLKETLKEGKNVRNVLLCAFFITINWGTYIWAVNSGNIVQSSMGYYINPLMMVILGMTVLKERLNVLQYVSIGFAAIGVAVIAIQFGSVPWVALLLASSFALYGLFKKLLKAESLVGLALETTVLVPLAFGYILYKLISGQSALYSVSLSTLILLTFSGIATATPLLWYAMGSARVKLSTIGFLQYISPTISLFLGIFVYGEKFTRTHLLSFSFIWIALVIYSFSNMEALKKSRISSRSAAETEKV
ncbi:MAG TPA: EamA family transporter RarD [Clostridia bacterium]|nr:EamA family transporter RarD [Clostridia bacterium]